MQERTYRYAQDDQDQSKNLNLMVAFNKEERQVSYFQGRSSEVYFQQIKCKINIIRVGRKHRNSFHLEMQQRLPYLSAHELTW